MTANSGRGPGAFGTSPPAWALTAGATVVDNGVTWTTEKIQIVRANGTTYAAGDRVYADGDNRFLFVCTVGGKSAGSPPPQMVGGDTASGVMIGSTFTDDGVTWLVAFAVGIYVRAGLGSVRDIDAQGFTNYAVAVLGGIGQDAEGTFNADNFQLDKVVVQYCGGGAYIAGDDTNGYEINRLFGVNLGTLQPTPNIATGAGFTGLGGHILHCHSQASGLVSNLYAQLSTGRAILKNGLGRITCVSCYEELGQPSFFGTEGGGATIIGGSVSPPRSGLGRNVLVLRPTPLPIGQVSSGCGQGISEADVTNPVALWAALLYQGNSEALPFCSQDEQGNTWGWYYGGQPGLGRPTGYWGLSIGNQGAQCALSLSSTAAGFDPCPGWPHFPGGYLIGRPGIETPIIDAPRVSLTDSRLRSGLRRKGDRFRDGNTTITLTSDGYRGQPWTKDTPLSQENTLWTIPVSIIEPTANVALRAGGEQVWKVTTTGRTHLTTEPSWPGAPTPGVTTVRDGTVDYTFLGYTPSYIIEQATGDKAPMAVRFTKAQTTTTTANQVIESGGVIASVDFALSDNAVSRVTDLVHLHKPGTAHGGTIEIKSDWVRNGGAPTQIGTSVITYNLAGTTLDATTVAHVANGNRIELQASPKSADVLNWRVCRTLTEGVD